MRLPALFLSLLVAATSCAPSPPNAGTTTSAAVAAAAAPTTVVYLVRHAEKVDASRDPALSPAGDVRAVALGEALRDAGVQAVVTTQYQRTQLTAAPLARSRALTAEVVEAGGGTATHAAEVARVVRERHAGETVLVVGHSNTVPAIVAALGGPALPELCDAEYSRLFVLVLDGNRARLTRARYGAPDAPDAAGCAAMRAR
jgi:broad specificity phosphatase PhoE